MNGPDIAVESSVPGSGEAGPGGEGAGDLRWMLDRLVEEVPGLLAIAVVSSDGLPLLSQEAPAAPAPGPDERAGRAGPRGAAAGLATVVSGLAGLTAGAAELMDGGGVRQTLVAMDTGSLLVMTISAGSLLGAHTSPDADLSVVAYQLALFTGRARHLLTPGLRAELHGAAASRAAARAGSAKDGTRGADGTGTGGGPAAPGPLPRRRPRAFLRDQGPGAAA
ncbi:hypothetical protein GCM10009716_08520 [Streptomyces sodiiphilus]|uniref:Roadblock/LAMTOR2 domain-containing protein n=1 Tax=Streptomyces sodiiphilus TaxID=226217 RepID=A0ABN2NTB5_9ACTN